MHRAERTAALADALADLLSRPLPDAFALEVVAVPAKGVERWLAQRLSGVLGAARSGDGICSGVRFPSATALVDEALAAATGPEGAADLWARPLWPLLEVVDESLDEPWCAVLAAHLGHAGDAVSDPADEHRRGRRYTAVAHLAELFRSYAAHRPQMLRDWAAGRDTDGSSPLADDLRWQAELWRRLRGRLGPSPAERLGQLCDVLRSRPEVSGLPERLSLFGPTRLTTDQLLVLEALGAHRAVHLWLPHPSPIMWQRLTGTPTVTRRAEAGAVLPQHPLLRSLARDVRELQLRLPPHRDTHHDDGASGLHRGGLADTLLGRLQADLRADRPASPATADDSLRVHACHGPARQVEVLRELLLGAFQDDPGLEPRDVLVMCPDVETYAPLVSAAFGLGPGLPHPGHGLRVRLADRSLRQTNPLLDTVAVLLDLAGSRVTASAVLDLAASPAVRRRFGFDDDDLERVRGWVARSGVRWGFDAAGRAAYGMDQVPQNTWRAGLDRLLLGVTTSEEEPVWLGLALPLDDVDSSDIALAGQLAELLDRLEVVLDQLAGEHPVVHWVTALLDGLDSLTSTRDADAWQLGDARRELTEAGRGARSTVRLADVRAMLADRLRGRPTRAGFRTGDLTVCTMVPMRSVPHRVVVLLGLDDGIFPRAYGIDGDDVLARDPCTGERDPRSEDRQLFLDAVLAAGERLVVLFTGADPVSGATRPPAVPVGELLDVVEAMAPGSRRQVLVRHPLQPHDARDFRGDGPFSFDPVGLAGARSAALPRVRAVTARGRLPLRRGDVALADLVSFVEHPVRGYLRQRLRITLPGEDDEVDDALAVTLDGLQEWALGERVLRDRLRGLDPADSRRVEWLRGNLPPGPLGVRVLHKVEQRVQTLVDASASLVAEPARAVDIRIDLGGRVLSGTVGGVRAGTAVTVSYSTLAAKHRLRAWVHAIVLSASGEGDRAVAVGRRGNRARTATSRAPADALGALARLVELHDAGLREPLPLAARTSAAYAACRLAGDSVEQAVESAVREWRNDVAGEQDDAHHRQVWGDSAPLAGLLEAEPYQDERRAGEPTRFGAIACGLWEPVLQAEQLT